MGFVIAVFVPCWSFKTPAILSLMRLNFLSVAATTSMLTCTRYIKLHKLRPGDPEQKQ